MCHWCLELTLHSYIQFLISDSEKGETLRDTADESGNTPLHVSAYDDNCEVTIALLENKADTNAENEDHKTPIHLAAERGNNE